MGETLAIGSLLTEGRSVRLAGQDSRRGTFGQRHAVIVDRDDRLAVQAAQAAATRTARKLYVYDSLLSEFAAMGFEYGYSVARPDALVMWEAQFGDFVNGAQTIIDEFISSGEQKWGQRSSLVLLLPHGYEGQGPDHSSARVERFLQMCAQDNMTVAMPSTPASYFHLLRWQVHSELHRPLVVFTPKSMLRLKAAASATADFTSGYFRPCIRDTDGRPGRRPQGAAVQRQGLLGPGGRARGARASPTRRSSGSSGSTRCRTDACAPRSAATRDSTRCAGSRRSRPTRAPGRSWRSTVPEVIGRPLRPGLARRVVVACGGVAPPPRAASRRALVDRRLRLTGRQRVYFTDRGIEELDARRGEEQVTLAWLAGRLAEFVDLNPEFEIPVERLATWLARLDDEDDDA